MINAKSIPYGMLFVFKAEHTKMSSTDRYNFRGVSASKEDVHNAIKNIDKGLFPKAFCKIIPDYLGSDKDWCTSEPIPSVQAFPKLLFY